MYENLFELDSALEAVPLIYIPIQAHQLLYKINPAITFIYHMLISFEIQFAGVVSLIIFFCIPK